ncbi:hypothetical protein JJD41_08700 [Oxynema sp. CENA135]|uniref:hypothetical protein n=1 Tax=Oxynema sp. CENA135 TaxID=984206 RepID=UPI001909A494|nr:hypothetical protein [Oxynema sp. CENA135]MBK4729941.1 hypothetical protein [Oxynema sp. CENA135]
MDGNALGSTCSPLSGVLRWVSMGWPGERDRAAPRLRSSSKVVYSNPQYNPRGRAAFSEVAAIDGFSEANGVDAFALRRRGSGDRTTKLRSGNIDLLIAEIRAIVSVDGANATPFNAIVPKIGVKRQCDRPFFPLRIPVGIAYPTVSPFASTAWLP